MVKLEYYNFQIKKTKDYYLFRYFGSFDKLELFLRNGIYLSRADKFMDNLECVSKDEMVEINKFKKYQELYPEHNMHISKAELDREKASFQNKLKNIASSLKLNQQKYFISCWYISDSELEDELMWRSYGKASKNDGSSENGFLVKINLYDFLQHFEMLSYEKNPFDQLVLGQVKYYDFSKSENIKEIKYSAFRKHASFSSEKEFRILFKDKIGRIDTDKSLFIKPWNSFYQDVIIYSHPNTEYSKFLEDRQRLSKFDKDLNMSDLNMWYQLKSL